MDAAEIEHWRRGCLTKKMMSADTAARTIRRMAREGIILFAYRCVFCVNWHLTGQSHYQGDANFTVSRPWSHSKPLKRA